MSTEILADAAEKGTREILEEITQQFLKNCLKDYLNEFLGKLVEEG